MKTLIYALLCLIPITACFGQTTPPDNLDGKTYVIESYIGDEKQPDDLLSFKDGKVEAAECKKWGFFAADYSYNKKDGSVSCLMTSEKEGKMTWTGKVEGSQFSGTVLWVKSGQDDIIMAFKGSEKKK